MAEVNVGPPPHILETTEGSVGFPPYTSDIIFVARLQKTFLEFTDDTSDTSHS
jgi:hypothetical protein